MGPRSTRATCSSDGDGSGSSSGSRAGAPIQIAQERLCALDEPKVDVVRDRIGDHALAAAGGDYDLATELIKAAPTGVQWAARKGKGAGSFSCPFRPHRRSAACPAWRAP